MHLKKLFSKSTADFWLNLLIVVLLIALLGQCAAFLAEFVNVTEQGELFLRLQNKEEKKYHFKQIRFVL